MISLALVVAVSLGGVDSISKVSLGKLTFKAPTSWDKSQPDDNSLSWEEPESGASMAVSVFPVDPQRPAKACLAQLVDALGKEGFNAMSLGAQPASKKVTTDFVGEGEGEEAKTEDKKVTSTTVLGCNGKTKWVLTWTAKTSEGARFGPMLKRVLDSISYGK